MSLNKYFKTAIMLLAAAMLICSTATASQDTIPNKTEKTLLLYQRTEPGASLPSQAVARPTFWHSDRAPKDFWDAMDALLVGKELDDLLLQYRQQHGDNSDFWPLEAQALEGLAHLWNEPEATRWNSFPGLPLPGDITQQQALRIAHQAMKEQGMGQEELDHLRPIFRFYNYGDVQSGRGWLVQLVRIEDSAVDYIEQYVIDAVDGHIVSTDGDG